MIVSWTLENDAKLRELFDRGATDREIARHFGCGIYAIENRRKKLRLRRPFGGQVKAPDAPTDRYPTGPEIDAMFRAAERPSRATSYFDCATGKVRPLARMAA